jgi:hypothetical protein
MLLIESWVFGSLMGKMTAWGVSAFVIRKCLADSVCRR